MVNDSAEPKSEAGAVNRIVAHNIALILAVLIMIVLTILSARTAENHPSMAATPVTSATSRVIYGPGN